MSSSLRFLILCLINSSSQTPHKRPHRRGRTDQHRVQPSLQRGRPADRVMVLNPFLPLRCASGQTFCEGGELAAPYPLRHILAITGESKSGQSSNAQPLVTRKPVKEGGLSDASISEYLTGMKVPPWAQGGLKQGPSSASSASYNTEEPEEPLCLSQTRYVRPRAALNTDLEWRYILNVGGDQSSTSAAFEQVVRVEVCLAAGKSCTIDTGGQQTVCRQKYAEHRLVALSSSGLEYSSMFLFPSCCVCHKKGRGDNFRHRKEDG